MINKFHELSRATLQLPPKYVRKDQGMVSVRTVVKELRYYARKSEEEQRSEWLERIHRSRQMIMDRPNNEWLVYELCKDIYELAEIDRVDFNGASLKDKKELIRIIVRYATIRALNEGVAEYHESRIRNNWKMNYLSEPESVGVDLQ
jgi:hypothetical protein